MLAEHLCNGDFLPKALLNNGKSSWSPSGVLFQSVDCVTRWEHKANENRMALTQPNTWMQENDISQYLSGFWQPNMGWDLQNPPQANILFRRFCEYFGIRQQRLRIQCQIYYILKITNMLVVADICDFFLEQYSSPRCLKRTFQLASEFYQRRSFPLSFPFSSPKIYWVPTLNLIIASFIAPAVRQRLSWL